MEKKEITYHDAEHLGIAVDTDRGLLVPVIHNAGDLNLGRHRPQDRRPRRAYARQQGEPGRARRRDVHADQHRQPRRAVRHADHQPAAGRHPRHRRGGQACGRRRGRRTSARRSPCGRWSTSRCPTTTASSTAPTQPGSWSPMKQRLEAGAFERALGLGLGSRVEVVLAGASGLIGGALRDALRADGHHVKQLVRHETSAPDTDSWDPAAGLVDPDFLAGADAVVCLSGVGVGTKRWTEDYKQQILQQPRRHRRHARPIAGRIRRRRACWSCASAVGYYGDTGDRIVEEGTPSGSSFLADVCRQWEAAADPGASGRRAGRAPAHRARAGRRRRPDEAAQAAGAARCRRQARQRAPVHAVDLAARRGPRDPVRARATTSPARST